MFWKHSSGARPPRFPVSLSTGIRHCHSSFPGALPCQRQTQTVRGWPARTKMRVRWDHTRGGGRQGPERLPAARDNGLGERREGVPELWVYRASQGRTGSNDSVFAHLSIISSFTHPASPLYRRLQSRNSRGWGGSSNVEKTQFTPCPPILSSSSAAPNRQHHK